MALTNLTLPYIKKIVEREIKVLREDAEIRAGLNIFKGRISYKKVAEDHNLESLYREYK